jgi:alpha-galactosidase
MYGVDTSKPAGQAYYDSIVRLYAQWGVDYIKADDMSWAQSPPAAHSYHGDEIEALSRAIVKSGRPIVLSLSPDRAELVHARHLMRYCQLWRISDDFWDDWKQLKETFALCRVWAPYIGPNHWPDADMLPLGRIRIRGYEDGERHTRLTKDEQITTLTLWSIFRSPLMMGGDLPSLDPFTLSLLTNEEVLAVDQKSTHNRELFARGNQIAWVADVPGTKDRYLAVFNLAESPAEVVVAWSELGVKGKCAVRDLWENKRLGAFESRLARKINPHGAGLYRVSPPCESWSEAARGPHATATTIPPSLH